jgi:uncharacterized protein YmfQ (DUF2313 family)
VYAPPVPPAHLLKDRKLDTALDRRQLNVRRRSREQRSVRVARQLDRVVLHADVLALEQLPCVIKQTFDIHEQLLALEKEFGAHQNKGAGDGGAQQV